MHAVSFSLILAASSPGLPLVTPPQNRAIVSTSMAEVAPSTRTTPLTAPSAAATPDEPTATQDAEPTIADRASNLLGGVWQCDTMAGNTGTHTYTANEGDGSFELQTELHVGFRTFRIVETYRFDAGRKRWKVDTDNGVYAGTALPWTGYKWTFDGIEKLRGQRREVRMVYFDLGDQAFRRDYQTKQNGSWSTYSAETCRRPSN